METIVINPATNDKMEEKSLNTRAKLAIPNKTQLRLYESRKQTNVVRKSTAASIKTAPAARLSSPISAVSLGTRAKKAAPNSTHLRLYEDGLRRQKEKKAAPSTKAN